MIEAVMDSCGDLPAEPMLLLSWQRLPSTLASMLKIEPLIRLRDGLPEVNGWVRTQKRATNRMVALVTERIGDRPAAAANRI
ncbi:MAG: DegV family protein [Anaerolineales bacterium]|nr:DegV family protein [Anaerolineales bacterium]NOR82239.1 hypothetical protein [Ardenticatenales bacterium]